MLPTQRRQAILAQVRKHSAVSADELAREFGVSVETIRRDLRRMTAKRGIAKLAASLVEPGDTVIIDVGTTALEVARALPATFEGRVLTNSVPVAMELSGRREIELLLCGGQVRHGDGACAGAQRARRLKDCRSSRHGETRNSKRRW